MTSCSSPYILRPDSHLRSFFIPPSPASSGITTDTEVSFSASSSSGDDSLSCYFQSVRDKLSEEVSCAVCTKKIFFTDYVTCQACLRKAHASCFESVELTSLEQPLGVEESRTLCDDCRRVNKADLEPLALPQMECWAGRTPEELYLLFESIAPVISTWSPNLFEIPFNAMGRSMVTELTRLAKLFVEDERSESFALTALVLAPALLMQKPSKSSKTKDHVALLERRLEMWKNGDFETLFKEAKAIQKPLKHQSPSKEQCDNRFVTLMRKGQTTAATQWLDSARHTTGVKPLTPAVIQDLEDKHPTAAPLNSTYMTHGPVNQCHLVTFDAITAETIYKCAKNLRGSAGPNGLDASGLQRILCSRKLGKPAELLRDAIALVARKLATKKVRGEYLGVFCASRLIPLEKNDGGTRPIGIGETLRRVITKAIVHSQRDEIKAICGKTQLAAGQSGGCEAAVHSLRDKFGEQECEAVLILDASNAFNAMNRKLALNNIAAICPILSTFTNNIYSQPRMLYTGTHALLSEEGSTQGCPASMGVYSLNTVPLINSIDAEDLLQIWYADDGNAGGSLEALYEWLSHVMEKGEAYGYHVNLSKCVLIVKEEHLDRATELFANTEVQITSSGARHLGAVIGSEDFKSEYVTGEVEKWMDSLRNLIGIAKTHPHLAYVNFTRSLQAKWRYVQRTVPDVGHLFQPLEDLIRSELIPSLIGQHCDDQLRRILALPISMGGLGLENPVENANHQYSDSRFTTEPLVNAILDRETIVETLYHIDKETAERRIKCDVAGYERKKAELEQLVSSAGPELQRAMELNREQGASSWLSARPITFRGQELTRQEWVDAMRLRYTLHFPDLKNKCECGKLNGPDHALSCSKGGYSILRHDTLRDCFAEMLKYAGVRAVTTEEILSPCDGFRLRIGGNTEAEARMDITGVGLWGPMQKSFMDIRVFHPGAPSYRDRPPAQLYKSHAAAKKRAYNQRVQVVEGGTFTPLVFSTSGGSAPEVSMVLKKIAAKIAKNRGEMYSETINFLRQKLRFRLLKATLLSLRGSRETIGYGGTMDEIDFNL